MGDNRVLAVEGGEGVPLWCAGAELYGGVAVVGGDGILEEKRGNR